MWTFDWLRRIRNGIQLRSRIPGDRGEQRKHSLKRAFGLNFVDVLETRVLLASDFGDAPVSYGTLLAADGARHEEVAGFVLGFGLDTEADGQPSFDARGDDFASMNDEDGVFFVNPVLVPGAMGDMDVRSSLPGKLDAWIDFNHDGTFHPTNERITLAGGTPLQGDFNTDILQFPVPMDAVPAEVTFARFRFSSAGGLLPTGPAADGEVEDYAISVTDPFDFGDAPASYGTTLASNGARHTQQPYYQLGSYLDGEPDGQATADATGDDNDFMLPGNTDDEDGVTFRTQLFPGQTAYVEVTATQPGFLDAWIDFNGNGTFESVDERITQTDGTPLTGFFTTELVPFSVRADATPTNQTFARFRFSSTGGLAPTGLADNGEVEDYTVAIENPLDFGDAPDTYGTLQSSNGARHTAGAGPALGGYGYTIGTTTVVQNAIDSELNGQPDVSASADDFDYSSGFDDENGVSFPDPTLLPGRMAQVQVTASAAGKLDAWIDFNGNGTFDDPADRITLPGGTTLTGGFTTDTLTFTVPVGAVPQIQTYARFRVSSAGGLSPTGPAPNGEVEDYTVSIEDAFDFGDAPDPTYATLLANNGPRHAKLHGFHLGSNIDGEPDGQPNSDANGDDYDYYNGSGNTYDEDGVSFLTQLFPGQMAQMQVNASQDGKLDAWVDFNGNGAFDDPGERITAAGGTALVAGDNIISFGVLGGSVPTDQTFARFRFSSVGGLTPVGPAMDGEVEDYAVSIEHPLDYGDAPDSYGTLAASNGASAVATPNFTLGYGIDGEPDGLPTADATGDDDDYSAASIDDENGVTFLEPTLLPGQVAHVSLTASAAGLLDAWIDFNGNGSFDAVNERITNPAGFPLTGNFATETLMFDVPGDAVPNPTFARFRLSATGALAPTGPAGSGEVEDYAVLIEDPYDFGDAYDLVRNDDPDLDGVLNANDNAPLIANPMQGDGDADGFGDVADPDPANPSIGGVHLYDTLLVNNGPRHLKIHGFHLGPSGVDGEPNGQPNLEATGDDYDYAVGNFDDEDGVSFLTLLFPGQAAQAQVYASQDGWLDAWVDFNHNGSFSDPNERITVPTGEGLSAGYNTVSFAIPAGALPINQTMARFRFSTAGGLAPTGPADDGEVEDYLVSIEHPLDYGDAPNSYGTVAASNGASHVAVPGFTLGGYDVLYGVDGEADGLPTADATGDDYDYSAIGFDDEDGVFLPATSLLPGRQGSVQVVAALPGRLDAWIDFNADGAFNPTTERITLAAGTLLTGGYATDSLTFDVPAGAIPTDQTYARFRFSSAGGLLPTGPASDGEVEDYTVSIEDPYDYGDAPDPTYPTLLASGGARHLKLPGYHLGYSVDGEPNGQPTADATGDDNDYLLSSANVDDDDGITNFSRLSAGDMANVDIVASAPGLLNAWIDFNADGDWNDAGEQVAVNVPLSAGTNPLAFQVPEAALPGSTFARLRFSSVGGLTPTGDAPDGEVEDYRVAISALRIEDLTGDLEPIDLANQLVGSGVTISNVVYTGAEIAAGNFERGPLSIGFETGIILSTGSVANVVGPNVQDGITGDNGTAGDANLDTLSGFQTFDASVLEFDFIPDDDLIVFRYVFGSDEYNEYVNSPYNDTFAFFVNGVNYAIVGAGQPVSINTINNGNPFGTTPNSNSSLYRNNDLNDGGGSLDTEMDGLTVVLTLAAPVNAGVVNHMKLAIADASDRVLDSNVFIETASFQTAELDFGDAPNSFYTLLTSDGARHAIVPGLYLGGGVDGELDGQPGPSANGDDLAGVDDEDGVVFTTPLLPGQLASAEVLASAVGLLDAWIDFDGDGEFEDFEKLQGDTIPLAAGINIVEFDVPPDAESGPTYARFRFSRQGDLDPEGFAADGEVEDYTVSITENRGTITIVKDAVPNSGQDFEFTGDLGIFSLDDDADPDLPALLAFTNRVSGTYVVTESAVAGWDLSGLVINDPDNGSSVNLASRSATIDLDPGENIVVTFTNAQRGSITVVKQAAPEDPQDFTFSGSLGNFILDDDDDPALNDEQEFANLVPGTYVVTEAAVAGWDLTGLVINDPDGGSGVNAGTGTATIDLDPGENITVEFQNTQRGGITVIKDALPDGPQDFAYTGNLGAFSLDDDSDATLPNMQSFNNLVSGVYVITEAAVAGWDLTGLVINDPDGGSSVDAGTGTATIDLDPGENITVEFRNTQRGGITVIKDALPDGPQDFAYTSNLGAFSLDDDSDATLPNMQSFNNLASGVYVITEAAVAGWDLTGLVINDPDGESSINLATRTATIDLDPGELISVEFTNTARGSITVVKDADPNHPQDFAFSGGLGNFVLDDDSDPTLNEEQEFANLVPGTYLVTEAAIPDWSLSGLIINDPDGGSSVDLQGRTATIDLDPGESITVTFFNDGNLPPILIGVPTEVTIPEQAIYTFDADATDIDIPAQTLTFSLVGAPAGANIDSGTGVFTWTPGEAQGPGDYPFTVRVSDGVENTDQSLTLHVTEVNSAPLLSAIGDRTTSEGQTLAFTVSAVDSDVPAQTLTYEISALPPGATFHSETGEFEWTPAVDESGSYEVTFTVFDDGAPVLSDFETITISVTAADFGDAPDPTYPTLIANNGARHLIVDSGPRLGAQIDNEANGQPSAGADGDDVNGLLDDEDGITFLTTLIASASTSTISSVEVDLQNASATSNRLDAWIDFNADGDWNDAGEQVFTNLSLGTSSGRIVLPYSIPQDTGANVASGPTYARFRLSTAGGLLPTGQASDGEVEDYLVTIVQAGAADALITAPSAGGILTAELAGQNLLVRHGATTLFSAPRLELDTVAITGTDAANDTLAVNYSGGNPLPGGGLAFQGGLGGNDTLSLSGGSATTVEHTFFSPSDGIVTADGSMITYMGLEPITDSLSAVNRIFTFDGGAETITLVDAAGANMTIDSTLGESVTFSNPSGSLTINAGSGDDTVTIGSVDSAYGAGLTVMGGDDTDTVNLNSDITFAADADLNIAADTIALGAGANLSLTGAGTATLSADRNIASASFSGASISTQSGGLTLEGNRGPIATSGNFSGIALELVTLQSVSGPIVLQGRGGDTGNNNNGINLNFTTIRSTGTGPSAATIAMDGIGRGAHLGRGVFIGGALVSGTESHITSIDGDISVHGVSLASGNIGRGIDVVYGSTIHSTGTGPDAASILLDGTGANPNESGVLIFGDATRVTTADGDMSIHGNTLVTGAELQASGTGNINITGGSANFAGDALIETVSGNINLAVDNIAVNAAATVDAGTGDFNLTPVTVGRPIRLGAKDAATLSLDNVELNRISATRINIGDSTSGALTLSAPISPAGTSELHLTTGANVIDDNSAGTDITVSRLILDAVTGIGAAPVDIAVDELSAVSSAGGDVVLWEADSLIVNQLVLGGGTGSMLLAVNDTLVIPTGTAGSETIRNVGSGSTELQGTVNLTLGEYSVVVNGNLSVRAAGVNVTSSAGTREIQAAGLVEVHAESAGTATNPLEIDGATALRVIDGGAGEIHLAEVGASTIGTSDRTQIDVLGPGYGTIDVDFVGSDVIDINDSGDVNNIVLDHPLYFTSQNTDVLIRNIDINGLGGGPSTHTSIEVTHGHLRLLDEAISAAGAVYLGGDGQILDADGGTAVSVATPGHIQLAGSGGIGSASDPIRLAGDTLQTFSSNSGQYLMEADSINLESSGLSAGMATIRLDAGTFHLTQSEQIAGQSTIDVNGATLALGSFSNHSEGVVLTSGSITGTTGLLTSASTFDVRNGAISAKLGGTVGLTKSTGGTVVLSGANTYTGTTTVNAGVLNIQNGAALGSTSNGTDVLSGAALQIQGGISVAEPLILNGHGISNDGALRNMASNNYWSGTITLASDATIGGTAGAGNELVLFGAVGQSGGSQALNVFGPISLVMESSGNTYTGTTTVFGASGGGLRLRGSGVQISGDLVIGDGTNINAVLLDTSNQIADTSDVTVHSGSLLGLGPFGPVSDSIDELSGTGSVASSGAGTQLLTVGANNGSSTFDGVIEDGGVGRVMSITKAGSGTLTLTNANTYTGQTNVAEGTLRLNGSLAADSHVVVEDGGTLSGTGTANGPVSVESGGTVAPGASTGILHTGVLEFASTATYSAEINGEIPGTGYDQVVVTGTVNLNSDGGTGATLSLTGSIASRPSQDIILISNDASDPVMGRFAGLLEHAVVLVNGVQFLLTYEGGDGNDVALLANDVPVAVNDSYLVNEDVLLVVLEPGVLFNDTDAVGDALIAELVSDVVHGTLTLQNNGAFDYVPDDNWFGEDSFTYQAFDGTEYSNIATVTIMVTSVNDVPTLTGVPTEATIAEQVAYTFDANATDIDVPAQTLTFSLVSGPAGATIDSDTGEFSWTPTEAQGPGDYPFTVRVTDGVAHTDQEVTLHVTESNVAPTLTDVPDDATIPEQVLYTFDANATDVDLPAQMLTFSLVSGPAGATIDGDTGEFSWTPSEAQGPGDYPFTVRVSDGVANTDQSGTLHVTESNAAPTLTGVPADATIPEQVLYTFDANATDSDLPAQSLMFSLVSGPAGATIDSDTGEFSWTPTETQGPGDYPFTVRVSDGVANTDQSGTLHVTESNAAPTLTDVPANATIPELVLYTFDANATDVDVPAQSLTFSLVSGPAGATIDDATGVFSWTPSEAQGPGDYPFTVRVSDGVANTDQSGTLHVTESNAAPTLTDVPADATIPEQVLYTFDANATDSDLPAQSLMFSLVSGPAGAAVNSATGVFSWTPSETQGPGDYPFTVRVSDGVANTDQSGTLHVTESNAAPTLTGVPANATIPELALYTFDANAADNDVPAQSLTFSLVSGPAGATIDDATGVFSWTPSETQGPGDYPFTVRVSDGVANTDQSGTLHVTESNAAPTLTGVPADATIPEQVLYTFDANATDSDLPAQSLTFSLVSGPAGAMVNGATGVFSWTPSEAQGPGDYPFTVRVSDGVANTDQSGTLHVTESNAAPTLTGVPANATIPELVLYTFDANATDSDVPAQSLTFSLVSGPAGAMVNGATGVFSWTPSEAQGPGDYPFTVRVSDGVANTDQSGTLHVTESNAAPTLTGVPANVTIPEQVLYTFDANATDNDLPAQSLTFSLVSGPAGATIDSDTGIFSWTPTEAQGPGDYPFTVRVSDGMANTNQSGTLHVTESNTPPVLTGVPADATISEQVLYTFDANATDSDVPAQSLIFSLISGPAGAMINNTTGVFSWTPTDAQGPGNYPFTVRVTDGMANADQSVTLHVTETNTPPVLTGVPVSATIPEHVVYNFAAHATDPDLPAQSLTYSLVSGPAGAAMNSTTGMFAWTPTEAQGPGDYPITVRVSDGFATADQSGTLHVTESNVAPTLTGVPVAATIPEQVLYSFDANATDIDLPAQTLTFSLISGPTGAMIDGTTGVFSWTPTEAHGPGNYSATVRVTDGMANTDHTFTIVVTESQTPPTLTGVPTEATIPEQVAYTFDADATDSDLPVQTLTFSLVSGPAGASINSTTGVFSWTPSEAQGAGDYPFTVRVTDGVVNTDRLLTLHVTEVNTPPVLAPIGDRTANEGQTLAFNAVATDVDLPAQTLTYAVTGLPSGATFNTATGAFSWTPAESDTGTYDLTFTVTDSGTPSLSDSESITIVVTASDWGDAPDNVSLANDFPTLLASNGAQHLLAGGGLRLGAQVDNEANGQPTASADGDDTSDMDDEDGITFLTTLVASTSTSTIASIELDLQNASGVANRLDAWIDFNRDSDWNDPGEQVFTSFNLGTSNGHFVLPFTIPQDTGSNVNSGDTYARFRLSTAGGLSPAGLANDGEVEDYRVTIVQSASNTNAVVNAPTGGGTLTAVLSGLNVIVQQGATTLFSAPRTELTSLTINGTTAGNETLVVDFTGGSPAPAGGLSFHGGSGGTDHLSLTNGSATTVTHTFTNANNGSVQVDASMFNYTGLEPISDSLSAVNRVFTFNGGTETISLIAGGTNGNVIDSNLSESVDFTNPTGSLTINTGTGDDTLSLSGVGGGFSANVTINGGLGTDAVNVTGAFNIGAGNATIGGSSDVETINFNGGALSTTGNVTFTSGGGITDNDAGTDITATQLTLRAGTAGVGSSTDTLHTTVSNLEVLSAGGVWLDNTNAVGRDLTIGGIGALVGVSAAGTVRVTNSNDLVTLAEPVITTGTLAVVTADGIRSNSDGASSTSDITALNLRLVSSNGIGTMADALELDAATLAFSNTGSGDVFIRDVAGGVTIGTVDGQTASGNTAAGGVVSVTALSPLTVAHNLAATHAVVLTASDSAAIGVDNLVVNADVTIRSFGSNVTLNAGDDLILSENSSVIADGTITLNGDVGNADLGAGATITLNGNLSSPGAASVNGGSDGDTFVVFPCQAGGGDDDTVSALQLDGAGGSDTYQIHAGGLMGGATDVVVADSGVTGTDQATVYSTSGAESITVNNNAPNGSPQTGGFVNNTTSGERVNYSTSLERLEVRGDESLDANDGADTFSVQPSQTTRILIHGNNPQFGGGAGDVPQVPGDVLTFDPFAQPYQITGMSIVTQNGNPGAFLPVSFRSIERLDVAATPPQLTIGSPEPPVLEANGVTVDAFTGYGAPANTLITVAAGLDTNGDDVNDAALVVTSTDQDTNTAGLQVMSDANGQFIYSVRRPTASGRGYVTFAAVGGTETGVAGIDYAAVGQDTTDFRYDLGTTTSLVQAGYDQADQADLYSAAAGYGWVATSGLSSIDAGVRTGSTYSNLLRDVNRATTARTFRADVTPGTYDVTVTVGEGSTASNINVTATAGSIISGSANVTGIVTTAGQYTHRTFRVASADAGGGVHRIELTFSAVTAGAAWFANGITFRPAAIVDVNALAVTAPGGGNLDADGTTIDTFTVVGADVGSLYTVATTLGTITGVTDADTFYAGIQIAGTGSPMSINVRRPVTSGTATLTVREVSGTENGNATQSYVLPATRFIDMGTTTSPIQAGYQQADQYDVYTATVGYGWVGPAPSSIDRGARTGSTYSDLLRDANMSTSTKTFRMDATPGTYDVTITFGDTTTINGANVSVVTGSVVSGLANVTGVATAAGQYTHRTVRVATADAGGGQHAIALAFAATGTPWMIDGITLRPISIVDANALVVTAPGGTLIANGTSTDTFSVSGTDVGKLYTVAITQGTIASIDGDTTPDQDPFYAGIQVAGTGAPMTVNVTRPTNAGTAAFSVREVSGAENGSATQNYVLADLRRFDFNNQATTTATPSPTAAGFTAVTPFTLFTTTQGFGWMAKPNGYDRGSASGVATVDLYRDGVVVGTANFRVAVTPATVYDMQVYSGDSLTTGNRLFVSVESGAFTAQTAPLALNQYVALVLQDVQDMNGDGYLDISLTKGTSPPGAGVGYALGFDLAVNGGLPMPAAPLAAVSMGSGAASIDVGAVQSLVGAAIQRWSDAGLSRAAVEHLQTIEFRVQDLSGALLGLADGNVILIDRNAAGHGWFVDATPLDDAEFESALTAASGPAAGRIDLLSVLTHELGHTLGLADEHSGHDLMSGLLATSQRRLADLDDVFAANDVWEDIN